MKTLVIASQENGLSSKMTRLLITLIAALVVGGPAWGVSLHGHTQNKCSVFLGAYAKSEITGDGSSITTSAELSSFGGMISGFVTGVEWANSELVIKKKFTLLAAYPWLASWCRDNPDAYFGVALVDYTQYLLKD